MKFLKRYKDTEYFYTDKFIYAKKDGQLYKLALFDKHFYKLRLYKRIPILEIDGVRMHLVCNFNTPLDYSKEVVDRLRIKRCDAVLDTCMGLGYTAIAAAMKSGSVVTCELNNAVVALAKWNPWSNGLFSSGNIKMIYGDVAHKIKGFREKSFDVIIHDPPRFSHAPQLYSSQFYLELYRVLRKNGRLYHYVGSVGAVIKGRKIENEVANRLKHTGFRNIQFLPRLQGLLAMK